MKQVAYWDLSKLLDQGTDLDFKLLAYHKEVKDALLMTDVITHSLGKCNLSDKGLEMNMGIIEEILYDYDIELVFPTLQECM